MAQSSAWFACALLLVACGARPAASQTGAIVGQIDGSQSPLAVTAIDRTTNQRYTGTVEANTRQFRISDLPLEARYDLQIDFGDGRLEGVNCSVPASDYEEEQPLSNEDRRTLREEMATLNKFEDLVEVLAVEGNIQHAAVLVHKLRTRPFVNSKPDEVVWRVELWHFERPDETWVKSQDELFITLYRERIPRKSFDKKSVTFDPVVGGLLLTATEPERDLGKISLPAAEAGVHWRDTRPATVTTEVPGP